MAFHVFVFVFLLVVCLLLSLARLGRLDGFPLRPSSSRGGAKRTTVQRLLKPRATDDCPACRLASTSSLGGRPTPAPVRSWPEVKSRRGAPKRVNTEGFACPNPRCPYMGITDTRVHALVGDGKHGRAERIQTFRGPACRTTFTARRHTAVPTEDPLTAGRHGTVCTVRRAGPIGCRAGLRLPASHHHHLAHSCRGTCTDVA
jgi:hypothetical protein